MKTKFIAGLSLLVGCLISPVITAQTNVKIMDFIVAPALDQSGISTDSILLDVDFKISDASNASKVHFWLGTVKDSSNVFYAEPIFTSNNNIVSVVYNGISTEVNNYAADFFVIISKITYDSFLAATLFVETSGGSMTSRLYFMK